MPGQSVGKELIELGWDQGSLISARTAQAHYLCPRTDEDDGNEKGGSGGIPGKPIGWRSPYIFFDPDDYLVIVSHPCDIVKSDDSEIEPCVEAMRAFWTRDKGRIHNAGHNQIRFHLLRTRIALDGEEEGLIADAVVRIPIEKRSLLSITPEPGIESSAAGGKKAQQDFRSWLGQRYDRPPIDTPIVEAFQRPIVKAIDKIRKKKDDPMNRVLDGLDEILFMVRNAEPPFEVEMILLHYEKTPATSTEDLDGLVGWMDEVLKKTGKASIVYYEQHDPSSISLGHYTAFTKLPLDHYTSTEDDEEDRLVLSAYDSA